MHALTNSTERATAGHAKLEQSRQNEIDPYFQRHVVQLLSSSGATLLPWDNLRSLLRVTDGDKFEFELVGIPTAEGGVCYAYWHPAGFSGACAEALSKTVPLKGGYGESGTPQSGRYFYIAGVTADVVEKIDVVLATGETEPATMGDNAYFWKAPQGTKIKELLVYLNDGSVLHMPPAVPLA
jgi:hypothetical protein